MTMHPRLFSGNFHDQLNLSAAEFLAEKRSVTIIPNFNSPQIRLLSGAIGPFEAGISVPCPLWIGIYLKQRQKCRFVAPDWMKTEYLENLKDSENRELLFVEMPDPCWMETAQLLLQYACDDVSDGQSIKTLICDLADIRMAKLRNNMDIFLKSETSYGQINNLTQFEISRVREFFTSSMDHLTRLREAAKLGDGDETSTTRGGDGSMFSN